MANWWSDEAEALRSKVFMAEQEFDNEFTHPEIGRAIIYTRQDVVMIASLLSSLNRQVRIVKMLLAGLLLVGTLNLVV